jgi:hypothetical protein
MNSPKRKEPGVAKAGEKFKPNARAKLRQLMIWEGEPDEFFVAHTKTAGVNNGQFVCADCGEVFQNNMQAWAHSPLSHRRAWWTGERFEEP